MTNANSQQNKNASERNNDNRQKDNSRRVADERRSDDISGNGNRGNIRMFEDGLATKFCYNPNGNERDRRAAQSERMVNEAMRNGCFIPLSDTAKLGDKIPRRTGESVVYINNADGKVYKVKDPYAKAAMKKGVQPEDAAREHLVHNLFFPETAYTLEGISEDLGDVRIVLSQQKCESYIRPTKKQIEQALAAKGLKPDGKYSFGNDLVSVTDVAGDNAILGEHGQIYFIDPIILFKKPINEILEASAFSKQQPL